MLQEFLKSYTITNNVMLDTAIALWLIPTILANITYVMEFFIKYFSEIAIFIYMKYKTEIQNKFFGRVDYIFNISGDEQFYHIIRDIFFHSSTIIKESEIDTKTIGILNLLTKSRSAYFYRDVNTTKYNISFDNCHKMIFEDSVLSKYDNTFQNKKYFYYDGYYVVVSETTNDESYLENKKNNENNENKDNKKESRNSNKIIRIEAIRLSNIPKNSEIINKFLNEHIQVERFLPFCYEFDIRENYHYLKQVFKNCNERGFGKYGDSLETFLSNSFVKNSNISFKFDNLRFHNNSSKLSGKSKITIPIANSTDDKILCDSIIIHSDNSELFNTETFTDWQSINNYFFVDKIEKYNGCCGGSIFLNNNIISFGSRYYTESDINKIFLRIVSFGTSIDVQHFKEIFEKLLKMAKSNVEKKKDQICIRQYSANNSWKENNIVARNFDTIYLPAETKKLIITEFEKFIKLEQIYNINQVPYKFGMLFYGPPGTGKTSLVSALANKYNIDIYKICLSNGNVNDDTILDIFNSIPKNKKSILFFEDIDAAFSEAEVMRTMTKYFEPRKIDNNNKNDKNNDITNEFNKSLTYSGLLNAIDGSANILHGCALIMTTNNLGKLGTALVRPGRIDLKIELGHCNNYQFVKMCCHIIKTTYFVNNILTTKYNKTEIKNKIKAAANNLIDRLEVKITPAQLENYVLRNIYNLDELFNNFERFFVPK